MNHDQIKDFLARPEFVWYTSKLREQAKFYRTLADQPNTLDSERLWYGAKAQGIEDIIDLPEQWLKN